MPPKSDKRITAELKALALVYKDLWLDLRELNAKTRAAHKAEETAAPDQDELESRRVAQQNLITKKYGAKMQEQLDDFYKGPGENSSLAEKIAWVTRNYVAAVLSLSQDYAKDNQCADIKRLLWDARQYPGFIAKMIISKFAPDSIYLGSGKPMKDPVGDWNKYMEVDVHKAAEQYREEDIKEVKEAIGNWNEHAPLSLFDRDRDRLGLCMAKLEDAKTFYNSNEYKGIITALEAFSMHERVPEKGAENLTPEQNHAVKLITLKDMIDNYINHKAEDGVKKNVYHKLAAVEELNKFVTERISELNIPSFKFGNKTYAPREKARDNPTRNYELAQKQHGDNADVDTRECANTLDCMDRIISRQRDPDKNKELKDRKLAFLAYPGADGPDLHIPAEKEAAAKTGQAKPAPAQPEKKAALQAAAQKAIAESEKRMSMSKETREIFKNADNSQVSISDRYFIFDKDKEHLYCYAKRHDLKVRINYEKKEALLPISKAADITKEAAKNVHKYKSRDPIIMKEWRKQVDDNFEGIFQSVKADLKNRFSANQELLNRKLSDKELMEKWPDMKLDFACYKACFNEEYIRPLTEKYAALENRLNTLAGQTKKNEFEAAVLG